MEINPNYLAYCKSNGKTLEEQKESDDKEFPGGCMIGFTLWISKKKREFYTLNSNAFYDEHTIGDIGAWESFLQK
jgi:hypothetical protein